MPFQVGWKTEMSVAVVGTGAVTGGMVYGRPSTDVGEVHDLMEGRGMGCALDGGGGEGRRGEGSR